MKIEWQDGEIEQVTFGKSIRGRTKDYKRPKSITIEGNELRNILTRDDEEKRHRDLDYIFGSLAPAIFRVSNIKLVIE